MGYYTFYKLKINEATNEQKELMVKELNENNKDYSDAEILEYLINNPNDTPEYKWYEYRIDMEKLSSKFPEIKFTLNGEGEESNDIWEITFLNGKIISVKFAETNMVELFDDEMQKNNYLLAMYTENLKTAKTKYHYDKLKDLIESVEKPNEIFNTYYLANATEILEELKNKIREE